MSRPGNLSPKPQPLSGKPCGSITRPVDKNGQNVREFVSVLHGSERGEDSREGSAGGLSDSGQIDPGYKPFTAAGVRGDEYRAVDAPADSLIVVSVHLFLSPALSGFIVKFAGRGETARPSLPAFPAGFVPALVKKSVPRSCFRTDSRAC